MNQPPYDIIDELEKIVIQMRTTMSVMLETNGLTSINFYADYVENLVTQLKNLDAVPENAKLKFPLVWIGTPVKLDHNSKWYAETRGFDVFFIMETSGEYTGAERREKVFKPIIRPMYLEFMRLVSVSKAFDNDFFSNRMPHTEIEFYYFDEGNKSVLLDKTDCTKAENLMLKVNNNDNCPDTGLTPAWAQT